jgi:hypothetical protein
MSLCKMDCSLRLSHLRVTPAQVLSVTVPWSFLSLRQQTRAPTCSNLDWAPVICSVSLQSLWAGPYYLLGAPRKPGRPNGARLTAGAGLSLSGLCGNPSVPRLSTLRSNLL